VRLLMERNRREELEKLDNANAAGIRSATLSNSNTAPDTTLSPGTGTAPAGPGTTDPEKPKIDDAPPPVVKPIIPRTQTKDPEPVKEIKPEGTQRKGKKGDG